MGGPPTQGVGSPFLELLPGVQRWGMCCEWGSYPNKGRQIPRFAASRPDVPIGEPNPKSSEAPPRTRPALPEPGPQRLTAATALGPEWRVPASVERGSDWGAAESARPSVFRVPGTSPATPCPHPRGPPPTQSGSEPSALQKLRSAMRVAGRARSRSAARLARVTGMQPRPVPPRPARGSK